VAITTATGTPVSIADLATDPKTNVIYGLQSPNDPNFTGTANLYTINPKTGVATLVGNAGVFFGAIGFAPDGTLYMTSAELAPVPGPGGSTPCAVGPTSVVPPDYNCELSILNPATAATLGSVAVPDFYSALGVTASGVILAGDGAGDEPLPCSGQFCAGISSLTFTIGPGNTTVLGNTGLNFVADIAAQPTPDSASLVLFGMGLVGAGAARLRRRTKS
jgi:hypothetical protein